MLNDSKYRYVDFCQGLSGSRSRVLVDKIPKLVESYGGADCFATINHYKEPAKTGESEDQLLPIYFDLDSEDDLPKALEETRKVVTWFKEAFALDDDMIRVWFSGSKGFHIIVDHRVFGVSGDPILHKTIKKACAFVANYLGVTSIDYSVYSKSRLWRLPNTRHNKTGLYCVELVHNELLESVDYIKELAKQPRDEVVSTKLDVKPVGREWFKSFEGEIEELKEADLMRGGLITPIEGEHPVCIEDLTTNGIRSKGERNRGMLAYIYYLKDINTPKEKAEELVVAWHLKQTLTDMDEHEKISQAKANVAWAYSTETRFCCPFIRGIGRNDGRPIACAGAACKFMSLENQEPEKEIELDIRQVNNAIFCDKKVKFDGYVQSLETNEYLVPTKVKMQCQPKEGKNSPCNQCQFKMIGKAEIVFTPSDNAILSFLGSNNRYDNGHYKKKANIPFECKWSTFTVEARENVAIAELTPNVATDRDSRDITPCKVMAFFWGGKRLAKNSRPYHFSAVSLYHPETHQAVVMAYEAKAMNNFYHSFEMTTEIKEELKHFQPSDNTLESLKAKWKEIHEDFRDNVHHIRGREDMATAVDLAFHSVTGFRYKGKPYGGWYELLIIGDTAQGKTNIVEAFQKFYGCGYRITAESMSVPGLIGTVGKSEYGSWTINWGLLPKYDRDMVVFDECHERGRDEIFSQLTNSRSDGVIKIAKAASGEALARVRKIFIANPPYNNPTSEYSYPVKMLPELFRGYEDQRRFDMMVVLRSQDLDQKQRFDDSKMGFSPKFTSALCGNLIRWTWSLDESDIIWEPEVEQYINDVAQKLCHEFCDEIPLVDVGAIPAKLCRGAIAIAARTFSCDERNRLVVQKRHVDFYTQFLRYNYTSASTGYKRWSDDQFKVSRFTDEDERQMVIAEVKRSAGREGQEMLKILAAKDMLTLADFIAVCDGPPAAAQALFKTLYKHHLIRLTNSQVTFRKTRKGVDIVVYLSDDKHWESVESDALSKIYQKAREQELKGNWRGRKDD